MSSQGLRMALCSELGSLLRQGISQNGQGVPLSSMLNAIRSIRSMSSTKLFIGGLSWGIDDETLKDAFSGFGEVRDAKVVVDRDDGRSRGFGFVDFADSESASSAVSAMDGKELRGRNIHVSYANARPQRSFNNNYGGNSIFGVNRSSKNYDEN